MKYYKRVLLPISVAAGNHCSGGEPPRTCEHFNNEGGWPSCELNIDDLKYDKHGDVPKPKKCQELKELL